MIGLLVASALVCTSVPDHSQKYFVRLERPRATQVDVQGAGGPLILIVVDAMRPDRLSAYGFERETSPNLRALADDGVVFTNYYVNGNWTRPTTATMLTGLPPAIHGVQADRDRLAVEYQTIAERLHGNGIATGAVIGNGNAGSAFGMGRGFDYYADTVGHWKGLPSADDVVDLALPFVRKNANVPFFLMLFTVDAHDPYHAPEPYENMFVDKPDVKLIRSPHWELGRYSDDEIERMKATYDGALRYTDDVLGRFFGELKKMGIYDKATIIVTADHGEAFGEHGYFLHAHHLYDEIIRAPLIVRAPKMSARGVYSHYLFQSLDLAPTIASHFGINSARTWSGVNIFEHLRDPHKNHPGRMVMTTFNNFGIRRQTVRGYQRKVILDAPADRAHFMATVKKPGLLPSVSFDEERVQFFNIGRDPLESKNLHTASRAAQAPWRDLLLILRNNPVGRSAGHKEGDAVSIDTETYEDLKALGYIQ